MKIHIDNNRKVQLVQEEFQKTFPYLKIEFHSKAHTKGGSPSKKHQRNVSKTLGECRTLHNEGDITISPQMTISELENHFSDVYDLSVQVLRQSGNAWLETSRTSSWTLDRQNKLGRELSV